MNVTRYRRDAIPAPGRVKYDAAMSFEEIGARLGMSKQMAYFFYENGLRKLRRDPDAVRALLDLARARQRSIGVCSLPSEEDAA